MHFFFQQIKKVLSARVDPIGGDEDFDGRNSNESAALRGKAEPFYGEGAPPSISPSCANHRIDWSVDLPVLGAWPNVAKYRSLEKTGGGPLQYAMPQEVLPVFFEPIPTQAMLDARRSYLQRRDWVLPRPKV